MFRGGLGGFKGGSGGFRGGLGGFRVCHLRPLQTRPSLTSVPRSASEPADL